MTKPFLLAVLTATAASAQTPAPLAMDCHLLLRGQPMTTPTTYSVVGRDLFSRSGVGTTRLSTEGTLLPLGRSIDKGVVTTSWADHMRTGNIVTRRVYWQQGAKPRRLRFTERYDFANRTVMSAGERGDTCHADGR